MKSFSQFISENILSGFHIDKLKDLIENSEFSSSYKSKFIESLVVIEDFLNKKPVYKTDMDSAKGTLNRLFYSEGNEKAKKYYGFAKENNVDVFTGIEMNCAAKIVKDLAKFKINVVDYYNVAEIAAEANQVFKDMKSVAISSRKPKEPTENSGYLKPMAPIEAKKEVFKILKEASDEIHRKLTAIFVAQEKEKFDGIVKIVKDKGIQSRNDFKGENEKFLPLYFRYFADGNLVASPEKIYTKNGENAANDIIEAFLSKNTSKIALLFSKKTGLKSRKILENKVNPNGVLENKMNFEFTDGSKFDIYSKVEFSYSINGKLFIRVPTRFTNVVLANGTKMAQPSEEKMDKEF